VPLLDHTDCVLLIVDAQPGFYADLPEAEVRAAETALERAAWLTRLAVRLGIPVVVTEEDAARNGPTDPRIADALDASAAVLDKPTFGVTGSPAIAEAIAATGRGTVVVVGYETDVCVAQSAVGLRAGGARTVVVDDACFSPGEMHARGLARAAQDGVEINHCKGVAYEWVATVEASRTVIDADPVLADAPFRL
jgi:nicotinamidase-related amidase